MLELKDEHSADEQVNDKQAPSEIRLCWKKRMGISGQKGINRSGKLVFDCLQALGDGRQKQRNVGKGIQVFSKIPVAYPKPLLRDSLESGIVSFTFCSERINGFECQSISLNGKPVVVWNCHISGVVGGLAFLVKALMCAGTIVQMRGPFIGTAIFLHGFSVLCKFSIPMRGKTCFADWCTAWQSGRIFRISLVERNDAFSVIKFSDGFVDRLDIIGIIAKECAFLYRQIAVGLLKDI